MNDSITGLGPGQYSSGSPSYVDGKYGKSIDILNDVSYWRPSVTVHYPINLPTTSGYSFSLWFKQYNKNTYDMMSYNYQSILGMGINMNDSYMDITVPTNGTISFYEHNNGIPLSIDSPIVPAVGSWYHVCVVFSGTSISLYVNGNLTATGYQSSIMTVTDLYIGRSGQFPGHPSAVSIDELCVYKQALTSSQVQSIYNNVSV